MLKQISPEDLMIVRSKRDRSHKSVRKQPSKPGCNTPTKKNQQKIEMKFWTTLALFVVVLAVFLRVGHAEETEEFNNFEEKYLGYCARKMEDS